MKGIISEDGGMPWVVGECQELFLLDFQMKGRSIIKKAEAVVPRYTHTYTPCPWCSSQDEIQRIIGEFFLNLSGSSCSCCISFVILLKGYKSSMPPGCNFKLWLLLDPEVFKSLLLFVRTRSLQISFPTFSCLQNRLPVLVILRFCAFGTFCQFFWMIKWSKTLDPRSKNSWTFAAFLMFLVTSNQWGLCTNSIKIRCFHRFRCLAHWL